MDEDENQIEGCAFIVIPVFELVSGVRSTNVMKGCVNLLDGDFDPN